MVIREANRADAAGIIPLLKQLGYSGLDTRGVEEKITQYSVSGKLLVSEHEGHLTSFISLHVFPIFHSPGNAGRITAFCVDEQYRSRGIGIAMIRAAEDFFLTKGCTRVEVTSNNRRLDAHAFYLNHGYIEDSRKFVKYFR
jgi:GNAT superfamily N-acetyltransferase